MHASLDGCRRRGPFARSGEVSVTAQPKTILLVDDDIDLLLALRRRLIQAGYRALTATDAQSALERARGGLADAVLLDVCLAGSESGLDLARALQDDPATAPLPIIFVTGSATDDFKQRCEAAGGRYFVSKPLDLDLLLQVLRVIFGADELAEARRVSGAKRRQPV
jgi:CheY-like chemotaxis protein